MVDTIAKKSRIEKDWKTEDVETDPPLREAPKVPLLRIHGLISSYHLSSQMM